MSYIWENYKVDNEYILALKDFCPYTEIFEMVDGKANVNILYRFMNLYDILFAENRYGKVIFRRVRNR